MKIIADDQIPLMEALFAGATLIRKPGEAIKRCDLIDADMLWVRTVTQVDAALLQGTSVRFVGTATAGYDHLDTRWLAQHDIAWACAPGANAVAVAEYVLCVVAALRARGQLSGVGLRAGVIGVGRVGSIVAHCLAQIGFTVLLNDPPRSVHELDFCHTPLAQLTELDLLCVHAALTRHGDYPSYHLLDDDFLRRQKPGMVLLNAARGAVLDTQVLLRQSHLSLCLDVWENEPDIHSALLQRAVIATPHIAGYSVSAKRRASVLLYRQAQKFFVLPEDQFIVSHNVVGEMDWLKWEKCALRVFDPDQHTAEMRALLLENPKEIAKKFLQLRKEYIWRDSFLSVT